MAVDRDAPGWCVDALRTVTGDAVLLSGGNILARSLRNEVAVTRAGHGTTLQKSRSWRRLPRRQPQTTCQLNIRHPGKVSTIPA